VKHISGWTHKITSAGIIEWCREDGSPFSDQDELKKAKHSGTAYLRICTHYENERPTGLPTPFELTKDPKWDEGGEFLKQYDLQLKLNPGTPQTIDRDAEEVSKPVSDRLNSNPDNETTIPKEEKSSENNSDDEPLLNVKDATQLQEEFSDIVKFSSGHFIMKDSMSSKANWTQSVWNVLHILRWSEDANDGQFKEFCWQKSHSGQISSGHSCDYFENKNPVQPNGSSPLLGFFRAGVHRCSWVSNWC